MPKYRIHKDAIVQSAGDPKATFYKTGSTIDFDGVPNIEWQPLDEAASAAIEKRRAENPFTVSKNGAQAIDTRTGLARVFAERPKPIQPDQPLVGKILSAG